MTSEGDNRIIQARNLHIDEEDDFGILLATAHTDTIGAITIKKCDNGNWYSYLSLTFTGDWWRKRIFTQSLEAAFWWENISCELPYRHFDDNVGIDLFNNNSKRISVSGVQIKYSLVADDGILRLTKEGEQGEFILKPVPNNLRNKEFCPANEHLTMQIAAQVYGIPTAPNGLCFFRTEPCLFVRRFDLSEKGKLQKEDFASLAGLTRKMEVPIINMTIWPMKSLQEL